MVKLHQPHDQFFKIMLSDIEAARILIRKFLPDQVVKHLDLSTLRITDNTFLDDEMSSQYADLVFECALRTKTNVNVWISFLYEHKSTPEKYALIQVGEYLLRGYRKQIAEKSKPLRIIVPIIYYHGVESWEPGKISDLFADFPEELKVFIPSFEYIFQNITLFSDQEIQDLENNLLVPGLLIQKYFKNVKKLVELLEVIVYELSQMKDEGNYKRNYFVYLFDLFGKDKTKLMNRIEEMELPVKDKTKNYLLQMIEEGREEAREELRGKSIEKMIRNGLSTDLISDIMEVSSKYVERIRASIAE